MRRQRTQPPADPGLSASLDGPSRTITVERMQQPAPAPPPPAAPEPKPQPPRTRRPERRRQLAR
ncbi:MAG: hypothetical protein ACR2JP_11530 [Acidimicrobiia bacterium]